MMIDVVDRKLDCGYWNVVKGIGILLVVIGHACTWSVEFVYIFHLQLFFFVSGFLYSEKKYKDNPWKSIKKKFFSMWVVYVFASLVLVLSHNLLYYIGMQRLDCNLYSLKELLLNILYCFIGNSKELLGGTLWFLPVLFLDMAILAVVVWISNMIERGLKRSWPKFLFQAIVIIMGSYFGYYLINEGYDLVADIQVVFTVLIYTWIGYLIRNYYKGNFSVFEKSWGIIVLTIIAIAGFGFVFWYSRNNWIDLIFGSVKLSMYIPGFAGIIGCLILAFFVNKIPFIRNMLAYCGQNSLIIMIVHYPILRVMDKLISLYLRDYDGVLYNVIPVSFPNIWPLYLLMSILGSILIVYLVNLIKRRRNKND